MKTRNYHKKEQKCRAMAAAATCLAAICVTVAVWGQTALPTAGGTSGGRALPAAADGTKPVPPKYDVAALVYPGYHPDPRWQKELGIFHEGIGGKPVFMIYEPSSFVDGMGGMKNAAAALRGVKDWSDRNTPPGYPKLITINAWNEWIEGSYLEPDTRFKFGYLDAVKRVFGSAEEE